MSDTKMKDEIEEKRDEGLMNGQTTGGEISLNEQTNYLPTARVIVVS
jgi:hypothetical protein